MSKETIVYQANPLITGRRDFSLIETRLFYIGLRDIVPKLTSKGTPWGNREDNDFPVTVIPAKELVTMFGNDKYYNTLQGICENMAEKTVKIKRVGKKGFSVYPVFAELTYTVDEGLKLEFNSKMKPWLLDLADKPFTKLPFEQIWALRSSYAVRLLELLLQYQNTKTHERTLTIDEIRQSLGVPDEAYRDRMNNFKRYIIENTIKDINEKTAYKVEYENVKEGRKIVAFKFKLHLPADIKREKRKKQIADIGRLTDEALNASKKKSADIQPTGDHSEPVIIDKKTGKIVSQ